MKLKKTTQSGSLESSDILITVTPAKPGAGRKIDLESVVLNAYGKSIKKDIVEILDKLDIKDVYINANDRGAISSTIKARTEAALLKSIKDLNI
ncbi:citrate lyase acyl carrier protein [bacterium]|nr:citrate lyase acyl carrier protein [bacterium]MBT3581895.1 citrate lyase acyl carrier protein [bacterium]MBT4552713.1 citrate lyase acyl carrier protein [bacterium]MBT7087602.1 citrate lyase acyl carrier protein [bacterium]